MATYTFDHARAIPSTATAQEVAAGVLWTFVNQLLGNLGGLTEGVWTCDGSSDSVTAGMDGNNRWWNGGVFDYAKMTWGSTTGTARPWIVLRSPVTLSGGQIWLLINYGNVQGGLDYRAVYVSYSTSAFSGGTPTTVVAPTSANQVNTWRVEGGPTYITAFRLNQDASTVVRKCHLTLANDGGFWWGSGPSSGKLTCGFVVSPLADAATGDERALAIIILADKPVAGSTAAFSGASGGTNPTSTFSLGYLQSDTTTGGGTWGRTYNAMWGHACLTGNSGGGALHYAPIFPCVVRDQDSSVLNPEVVHNYSTGLNVPWQLDRIRQRYIEYPVYLCTGKVPSTSYLSIRGKLRDASWALGQPEGTNYPSGTDPITRVVWGDLWLPSPNQSWSP